MKKAVLLAFVLVFLSTAVALGFIAPVVSSLEKTNSLTEVTLPVHNTYSGKDFSKIQEAINDNETLDGHTILVDAGAYYEHVVVNKSLALIGEDKETTIIDGNKNGTVIKVTVSDVLIRNFTIRNSGVGWYYYGIRVEASRCNIIGNVVARCLWGVDLDSSSDSIILGNNITNNTAPGVRLTSSPNVTICENNITNNIGTAVWVNASTSSTVSRNNIAGNSGDGVVLLNSANTVVSGNNIIDSGGGIKDGYGVYLLSNKVLVERNAITRNYCGLAILGGDNLVKDNIFSYNLEGIYLVGSSFMRNQICHNNLIENENQVVLESSYPRLIVWDNGYPSGGNYWSNYGGVDLYGGPYQNETGSDGIGDTPFVIDANNLDFYPLMSLYPSIQAISIEDVQLKTALAQGFSTELYFQVANAHFTETFNVTAYANSTVFDSLTNVTLPSGDSTTVTLNWNATSLAKGYYNLSVYATPVPGELYTEDNTYTYWVLVTIAGDVDGDRDVDVDDQRQVQNAMFTTPGDPRWNPNMDVDSDLDVDVGDQRKQQLHMFETW